MTVPFNRPFIAGRELEYIHDAVNRKKLSGNGYYTQKCHQFFQEKFGFGKVLLTTSCTDALEMAAILTKIGPGDEVIMPSFTFPSTANAFALRGAKIIFADSQKDHPNIEANKIESLITEKTKVIVPVHYAGIACEMDKIMQLASKYKLFVVEDAAQAIDSYFKGIPLGKIGHFGAFSFHETKNISSGEGGMLAVNAKKSFLRAEIIWEKGTNRSAFFRGEVNKYGWMDIGSSFLPAEMIAAFLYAQLEALEEIQRRRIAIWNRYYETLKPLADLGLLSIPLIPSFATNNAHLFYIICRSFTERQSLIDFLKKNGVSAIFHYLPLHKSPFFRKKHDGRNLPNSERFSRCLLRLPLFADLEMESITHIVDTISRYFELSKATLSETASYANI